MTNLPVETVVVDPPEVLAAEGKGYTLVGAERSDRLAFTRARFTRLCVVRRTYRRDDEDGGAAAKLGAPSRDEGASDSPMPDKTLVTPPIPGALWPGVLADASTIAHAIISKYDDVIPLHRQEKITRREGFRIPRSTLCGWLAPSSTFLSGIVDAMFEEDKCTAFCIATDATSAPVRVTRTRSCINWHVFVFIAADGHIVFRHAPSHDAATLAAMLARYKGYLLGDAASIYSPLVSAGTIEHVCCWAHLRRYFFRALESDRPRALEAIAIIGKLFEIERECAGLPVADKTARRAELAAPVLALFDAWMERHRGTLDARCPLQAAFTYADNQKQELRRFLDDGRLRLDNNVCEGQLRNLVQGRDNWQYFENETGLRWYTTFRSLITSAKRYDLCPERYLECVLRLAPHWSQRRLIELAPKHWRATAARLSPEHIAIVRPSWSSAFDDFAPAPAQDAATADADAEAAA